MGQHHPVTWLSFVNFGMVILITIVSLYFVIKGRKVDKKLMLYNFGSGIVLICFYSLIFFDALIYDFAVMKDVSTYLLKPAYFTALFTLLWNIIRIGHKDDH
jgi:hypothetical protein